MNKKLFYSIVFAFIAFVSLTFTQKVSAQCAVSANACTSSATGGGSCSYSCTNTGGQWLYWCQPNCTGNLRTSCPAGQTCTKVSIGCNLCGNTSTCYRVVAPTNTPTPNPTNTPTPIPKACGQTCASYSECSSKMCAVPVGGTQAVCYCPPNATNTPIPPPPTNTPIPSATPKPTATPTPAACDASCTSNSQCTTGWCNNQTNKCDGAECRKPLSCSTTCKNLNISNTWNGSVFTNYVSGGDTVATAGTVSYKAGYTTDGTPNTLLGLRSSISTSCGLHTGTTYQYSIDGGSSFVFLTQITDMTSNPLAYINNVGTSTYKSRQYFSDPLYQLSNNASFVIRVTESNDHGTAGPCYVKAQPTCNIGVTTCTSSVDCNGGTCSNNKCVTCSPPPTSTPTPLPTATPTNTPTPTPAQLTGIVTQPPTPTTSPNVNRTTSTGAKMTQRWVCLNAAPCSQSSSGCSGNGALNHRAKLTTKDYKPISNADTYLFECVQTGKNICTTGISSLDQQVLGVDNKSALAPYGYTFNNGLYQEDGVTHSGNPVKSDSQGNIAPVEWESYTTNNLNRMFMAMNFTDTLSITGNDGGQQQGTLFTDSSGKKCITIKWDPYGRVFDGYTLEPIQNAKVTLLQKNAQGKFIAVQSNDILGGLVNPVSTPNDGSFAFVVPDGTYKLQVSAPNYRFTGSKNSLNKEYASAYSDIYTGGEIVQKAGIIHVDIAMDPIDKNKALDAARSNQVTLLSSNQTIDQQNKTITIEGRVSHPLSSVTVFGKKVSNKTDEKTRELGAAKADKNGAFSITIPINYLQEGESVGYIEVNKDLPQDIATNDNIFMMIYRFFFHATNSFAANDTVSVAVDPVLPYLDGIAMDSAGRHLGNVTVGLFVGSSDKPFMEIPTDANGHFVVGQADIPPFQYSIKYLKGNTIIRSLTTSEFIADNK